MQRRSLRLEPLEERSLLSASTADALLSSLLAYQSGNKGDSGDPINRVGYDLATVYAATESGEASGSLGSVRYYTTSALSSMSVDTTGNRVLLDVSSVAADPSALRADLAKLGFVETGTYGRMVSGWLPFAQIDELSALTSLLSASPVITPESSVGRVTSEGDQAMNADVVRTTKGLDGTGVKVGILSDSFNVLGGYSSDIASGDLQAGVQVIEDSLTGSDEGRAMAQIVHDVAPGASIAFATAWLGQASFAQNIVALAQAGCTVITDDVFYYAEPFFQDGVIAQAVNQVASNGVAYFSAAGNGAQQSYESAFVAGTTYADGAFSSYGGPHFFGGVAMDFKPDAGVSNFQTFTLGSGNGIALELQWDQSFASVNGVGSTNDVDIYILDSSNRVVAGSVDQNVGGDPTEFVSFYNSAKTTQTYKIMIVCAGGANPGRVKYINFSNGAPDMGNLTYDTNSGTCVGHANTAGAAAVGAVYYGDTPRFGTAPPVLEDFSSYGGTSILFTADGARLATPINLHKVDFTAPDGGHTTVPGFGMFYGTSAAAPHAAAVAALLRQFNPSLKPMQVITALKTSTLPMTNPFGAGSYNYASGAGLIQADAALQTLISSAATTTTTITSDHLTGSTFGQTVTFTATVTSTTTTPTGSVQFVIDGTNYGASVGLVNGTATLTISTLSVMTHRIDVIYASSDLAVYKNSSATMTFVVAIPTVSISGTIWNDSNIDALRNAGELPLAGFTIYVDANGNGQLDSGERTATTDVDGTYTLSGLVCDRVTTSGLPYALYTIRELSQSGWSTSWPSPAYYTMTVFPGNAITGKDFGNYLTPTTASVSGAVWNDANSNGVFDPAESPLPGWVVYVDTDNNSQLDTGEQSATTNANGVYTLAGLSNGTYTIREEIQSDWSRTSPSSGKYTVTVSAGGQAFNGKDFGNHLDTMIASITGTVWNDADSNRLRDVTESGLADWIVYVDANGNGQLDTGEQSAVTDVNGAYELPGLGVGSYMIREVTQATWNCTTPISGWYSVIVSYNGQVVADKDFGNHTSAPPLTLIRGTVWSDADNNGTRDTGETGLALWTVYIDADNDGQLDDSEQSTTTNASGDYLLSDLAGGTYTVREVTQTDWTATYPTSGFYSVTVASGQTSTSNNFGNYKVIPPSWIIGTVWNDTNSNGVYDSSESPLGGWTVYSDDDGNGQLDNGEVSTTTDSSGIYTLTGLPSGTYTIREVLPSDWTQILPSTGSYIVTLTSGQTVTGKDFGNYQAAPPSSINGTVWNDGNGNGQNDTGEKGLSGWTVYLDINGNAQLDAGDQSATTGVDGAYKFSNLANDTYTVREVVPTGWARTAPSTGSYSVTVSNNQAVTGKDFGNIPTTTTTITTDHPTGSIYGQSLKFTATVSANVSGLATPTGTLQFIIDGASYGSGVVLVNGSASIITSSLSATNHLVTVVYTSSASAGLQSSQANRSIVVTPAEITVRADNKTMVYGGPLPTYTWTIVGLVNGDTLVSGPTVIGMPALKDLHVTGSPYTIASTGAVASSNYTIKSVSGLLTVTPASLTITAEDKTMFAGMALPAFTTTITGFVNSDTKTALTSQPICTVNLPQPIAAGTYPKSIVPSGAAASDYTFKYVAGNLTAYAAINTVILLPDPIDSTKQSLFVFGTSGNDTILVNPGSTAGSVAVTMNGSARGTFRPTGRIVVHGLAGNDYVGISANVTTPAWVYGDDGSDNLWGGGGANLVFGGTGNDTLWGGKGRGVLIGDVGSDSLSGGVGDSMFIGGTTTLGANDAALLAILNEWSSSATYANRVGHITGTLAGGLNGSYLLNASTVRDDGVKDKLIGNSLAMDLFFQSFSDVVTGKHTGETTISV